MDGIPRGRNVMNNLPIYLFFIALPFHFDNIIIPLQSSFWLACLYGEINLEVLDMKNICVYVWSMYFSLLLLLLLVCFQYMLS